MIEAEQIQEATERITGEKILGILKPLSEALAPSGTVSLTRGPLIAEIWDGPGLDMNYRRTGNVSINAAGKKLLVAHADQISLLIPHDTSHGETTLVPFCAHRANPGPEYSGYVLRYVEKRLEVVAQGRIGTTDEGVPYFTGGGSLPPLRIGDRVVYNYPVKAVDGELSGSLDNAAGMASCLAAALIMREIAGELSIDFESLDISLVFSDEEEGPPASNATFGRGTRRYIRRTDQILDVMLNVDGHDVRGPEKFGAGALFASFVSSCKGPVIPPQLYVPFRDFMEGLEENGVKSATTESVGSVSRSDCVGMMEVSPNILILGYGTMDPHFNKAVPTANLSDLVHLSKAIVWTALKFEVPRRKVELFWK